MSQENLEATVEQTLVGLRQKRGIIKGKLTRFKNYLNDSSVNDDIHGIGTRLIKIEIAFDAFDEVQSELEFLDSKEEAERETVESDFFHCIARAKSLITSIEDKQVSTNNFQMQQGPNVSYDHNDSCIDIKLPSINLPTFSGEVEEFLSFQEAFSQLIDKRSDLSNRKKFFYLRGCLKNDALKLISHLALIDDNYEVALELLTSHYKNTRAIINKHIFALLQLPQINKESVSQLRHLSDIVHTNVSALKNLKVPVEHWDLIIINLIQSRLDNITNREWEDTLDNNDDLPTLEQIMKFLNRKCFKLESLQATKHNTPQQTHQLNTHKHPQQSLNQSRGKHGYYMRSPVHSFAVTDKPTHCEFCAGNHHIYHCEHFAKLEVKQKYEELIKRRMCTNCLRMGHANYQCKSRTCKHCNMKHNSLLHEINPQQGTNQNIGQTQANVDRQNISTVATHEININNDIISNSSETQICSSVQNTAQVYNYVFLATAQVLIYDAQGNAHVCRALLDSGSQSNIMSEELCNKLQIDKQKVSISVLGVNGAVTNILYTTKAIISSLYTSLRANLTFQVMKSVTGNIPAVSFKKDALNIPTFIKLADPDYNIAHKVDLLLGADIFYKLLYTNHHQLGTNLPTLQETALGWIITGKLKLNSNHEIQTDSNICGFIQTMNDNYNTDPELNTLVKKFWETEEVPQSTKYYSPEQQFCEDYFVKTTKRDERGRYVVKLPMITDLPDFGDSLTIAKRRFDYLECKFRQNDKLKSEYTRFMKEYHDLGHMSLIGPLNSQKIMEHPSYVLPHHAVIKESSSTTKCRVVFDASARTNRGISLNDNLHIGYTVQDDLFSIIMRLRLFKYVLSADVKMMFRQILIDPQDRKFQQIIWRNNDIEEIQLYELNTVTYGTASAPFLATRVLKQIALDYETQFPRTCKIIQKSFYMDDLLLSLNSVEEALEVYKELTNIFDSVGFVLRKWSSNEQVILNKIVHDNENDNVENLIEIKNTKELKTLGISWISSSDTLNYSIKFEDTTHNYVTKRIILSTISKIFDPLGLIGPATIKAKILIQKLWQLNYSWDEQLPPDLLDSWNSFAKQLSSLNDICIPRCLLIPETTDIELHGFCDASNAAYGCCLYIVSTDTAGQRYARLLCAKSRVAPLKTHTLPRLELLGAVLLSRLSLSVMNALTDINFTKISYYCDSTIVLSWIKLDLSQLKQFVANRIAEITKSTEISHWKHVRSQENPADIISRGINPNELLNANLWWNGPTFLHSHNEPDSPVNINLDFNQLPEVKQSVSTISVVNIEHFDIFDKYSDLHKMQRIVAYCYRFMYITLKKRTYQTTLLSVEELNNAHQALVRLCQADQFTLELKSLQCTNKDISNTKLRSLNPFIDSYNILRVGGRLKHSDIDYAQKHPIILPKNHKLTHLIIHTEHVKHLHLGPQNLLNTLRLQYWIIDGISTVKKVIRSCVKCFRVNPTPSRFLMGDLPSDRVIPSRPFLKCGVDYAGPLMIKDRLLRNAKLVKTYICLFVCFTTRAVHLELASGLTTDAFLNVIKRFVSRRGKPSKIYSDNGLNFKGASNHFAELYNLLNSKDLHLQIHQFTSKDQIEWCFIPPRSPHMGGLWEAAIKSCKFHLKRVIGNATVTYDELCTVLVQIEACLNSRPLTPLSNNPSDFLPLTPAHFLIGDSLMAVPQEDLRGVATSRLSRYQHLQQLLQHFWSRWSREYLSTLQRRSKWTSGLHDNLQVGDLVILVEDHSPPLQWPMARVEEIHQGADNKVRVVTVRLASGNVFRRSVARVCRLPKMDEF